MSHTNTFSINPIAPFRLDLTAWALKRRPFNVIDRWDGKTYRRTLWVHGHLAEVAVTQTAPPHAPRLEVTISGPRTTREVKATVTVSLERLLGTRVDLKSFYRLASRDCRLGPLAGRFRGLKPPRFPTAFEALANGIACQQISLSLGILLLNRITEHFGAAHDGTAGVAHAFPRPENFVNQEPSAFRSLGLSHQKGRSLIALAHACRNETLDAEAMAKLDNDAVTKRLLTLRGVVRWTAQYVLLRGMGRLDVFPGDDVGARNNLRRWLRLRAPLYYEGVRRVLAKWRPYAGLIFFHLLLDQIATTGQIGVGGAHDAR